MTQAQKIRHLQKEINTLNLLVGVWRTKSRRDQERARRAEMQARCLRSELSHARERANILRLVVPQSN